MTQITSTTNPLCINALIEYAASFLDRESLLVSLKVCKLWRQIMAKPLTLYLEEEYCRRQGISEEILHSFRKRHLSLWALPVLDSQWLGVLPSGFEGVDITFLTSPLMRIQFPDGRLGLAVSVRYQHTLKTIILVTFQIWDKGKLYFTRDFETALPILEARYNTKDGNALWNRFEKDFFNNPPGVESPYIELITGTHPSLEIAGEIEQIHSPLPIKKPMLLTRHHIAESEVERSSLCHRACHAICAFFSWLAVKLQALCAWLRSAQTVH